MPNKKAKNAKNAKKKKKKSKSDIFVPPPQTQTQPTVTFSSERH